MIQPDSRKDLADAPSGPAGSPGLLGLPGSTGSPKVVVFPPEVDVANSEAVGEALLAAIRSGVSVVVADLTATEFCDSSGIRHLIIANNEAASGGTELRVVLGSAAVRRALHVLEADQLLRIYPDMAAALTGALSGSGGTR